MRENRELEQQNLRLSHRVAFLEDQCASLQTALRSVAVSVESCLLPPTGVAIARVFCQDLVFVLQVFHHLRFQPGLEAAEFTVQTIPLLVS